VDCSNILLLITIFLCETITFVLDDEAVLLHLAATVLKL